MQYRLRKTLAVMRTGRGRVAGGGGWRLQRLFIREQEGERTGEEETGSEERAKGEWKERMY